jgi:hypothetical protein
MPPDAGATIAHGRADYAWLAAGNAAVSAQGAVPQGLAPSADDWSASPTNLTGQAGDSLTFVCPAGAMPGNVKVWGTGTYTDDSSVCPVHDGKLLNPDDGGIVTITLEPGHDLYTGSSQNGVNSISYGSWDRSFVIASVLQGSGTVGVKMGYGD